MNPSPSNFIAQIMMPSFGQALAPLLERIQRWYRHRRDLKITRTAFLHIVHLDERFLDDIGVTREEVLWAASLPLEENAASALRARAAKRKAACAAARRQSAFRP